MRLLIQRLSVLGLALGIAGCAGPDLGGGDPRILSLKELVGSIEVAEDADTELHSIDRIQGIRLMTTGALLRVPAGARVRIKFVKTHGILWLHGPAELEVVEARLQRGTDGIHSKIEDIHASFYLKKGVFAGAMEGNVGDRPSIEIVTDAARMQVEEFSKFAVVVAPPAEGVADSGGEAWVRSKNGPEASHLGLTQGGKLAFPPGAVAYWAGKAAPSDSAVEIGDSDFLATFLDGFYLNFRAFEDLDQLLEESSRMRIR